MKRRNFLRYAGASLVTGGIVLASGDRGQAQSTGPLSIQYLGHTCFLFSGSGRRILVNPFQPIGCTANYRSPKVDADLVLISSRLLDEGAVEEAAQEIVSRLKAAKNPVLIVGVEVHRFHLIPKVLELAERLQIPVTSSFLGRGVFPTRHPQFIGTYLGGVSPQPRRMISVTCFATPL